MDQVKIDGFAVLDSMDGAKEEVANAIHGMKMMEVYLERVCRVQGKASMRNRSASQLSE